MRCGIISDKVSIAIADNLFQQVNDILAKIAEILDVTVGDITRVLDEGPAVAFRAGTDGASSEKIFDMLDLFYANKHMYTRLQNRNRA